MRLFVSCLKKPKIVILDISWFIGFYPSFRFHSTSSFASRFCDSQILIVKTKLTSRKIRTHVTNNCLLCFEFLKLLIVFLRSEFDWCDTHIWLLELLIGLPEFGFRCRRLNWVQHPANFTMLYNYFGKLSKCWLLKRFLQVQCQKGTLGRNKRHPFHQFSQGNCYIQWAWAIKETMLLPQFLPLLLLMR